MSDDTKVASVDPDDEFLGEHHVYEARRSGLPHFRPYFRELWRRREFAKELTRTTMRAAHTNTAFGQLWLVINPLLLGAVYYLLISIIGGDQRGPEFFAHLLAGLFLFYFVTGSMTTGAGSVVGGGRLILNTSFPRALLPLSSTYTAFRRFLPTLVVYAAAHLLAGLPVRATLLWVLPLLAIAVGFAAGLAMFFATVQVYFRDTASFLPYITRIWLYLSPVLYFAEDVPEQFRAIMALNPLYPILGAWSDVLIRGESPPAPFLLGGVAWAVAALVIGGLFFMSREREFAVRL